MVASLPSPLARSVLEDIGGLSKVKVTQWGKPLETAKHVLFYFGGMPSSSEEPAMHSAQILPAPGAVPETEIDENNNVDEDNDIYAKRDIHLVCVDKPGMGGTSFKYNFRLRDDWPPLIAQVADKLNISKYSVCGMSNGGPYVMACLTHPDEAIRSRVETGCMVVGVSDVSASGYFSLTKHPSGFGEGLFNSLPIVITGPLTALFLKCGVSFMFTFGGYKTLFPEEKMQPQFVKDGVRRLFNDGARNLGFGAAIDCQQGLSPLYARKKGEAEQLYRQITVPVSLWYGTRDDSVPMESAEWLESLIPNAVLHKREANHFLYFSFAEEILDDLISMLETICPNI